MVSSEYASQRSVFALIFGIVFGFTVAFLFVISPSDENLKYVQLAESTVTTDWAGLYVGSEGQQIQEHALDNRVVANILFNEVKILCWVMTNPQNHKTRAIHVAKTWGSRCNKLLFMSSAQDDAIDAIPLPIKDDENKSWNKTKEAAKYIYNNHLDEYDWFLKADDDTYVIVENLRFLLYPYTAETPIYFGCKYKTIVKQGFMSSGAGYVLSREALRRFVEDAMPDKSKCRQEDDGIESTEIGTCLENVHVIAGDSRDSFGRGRFFPFLPEYHVIPDQMIPETFHLDWYWEFLYYKAGEGTNGCSDNAVSFHFVTPNQMYVLDYLIYQLRPYGITRYPQPLPRKLAT